MPDATDHQFLKTDAIILRLSNYSETSYVLSMLTRANGTMHALAKGARRPKTIFEGELDLLAEGQAVFIIRSGSLHLLTEFACENLHQPLHSDADRAAVATYAATVAAQASPEGHPQPEIYDLVSHTISALETDDIAATLAYFQVHLLRLSGVMPNFTTP